MKEFCATGRNFVWEWSKTHYWHWINISAHSKRNWKPESDLGFLVGFLAGMELLKMHELIHRGSGMYPALYAHVKYFPSAYCVRLALSAPLQQVWSFVSPKTLRSVSHDKQQEDRGTKLDAVAARVFLCNLNWEAEMQKKKWINLICLS